jgi:hypothetical protein
MASDSSSGSTLAHGRTRNGQVARMARTMPTAHGAGIAGAARQQAGMPRPSRETAHPRAEEIET